MRKKRVYKKYHKGDMIHGRVDIGRFINYVMRDGKKSTAEKIVYGALEQIEKTAKQDPVAVFEKALANATPLGP